MYVSSRDTRGRPVSPRAILDRYELGPGSVTRVSSIIGGAGLSASPTGRFVAFTGCYCHNGRKSCGLIVFDTRSGTFERADVRGGAGSKRLVGMEPALSGDGRYVAFRSEAPELVPGMRTESPSMSLQARWAIVTGRSATSTSATARPPTSGWSARPGRATPQAAAVTPASAGTGRRSSLTPSAPTSSTGTPTGSRTCSRRAWERSRPSRRAAAAARRRSWAATATTGCRARRAAT